MAELYRKIFDTKLGQMCAYVNGEALLFFDFLDRKNFLKHERKFLLKHSISPIQQDNKITLQIQRELDQYFQGKLKNFQTPAVFNGTPFQKKTWEALLSIPFGKTRSYKMQAERLNQPNAFRAVANANGANNLAVIVPCHRVIQTNGELGGYGGGIYRKKWLLEHEKNYSCR